jgi:hypothetical protein
MTKFYTLEQVADFLAVSTRTAQIGDKGAGRTGALVSHQKLSAPSGKNGEHQTRKDSAIFGWPCGEFEVSHIKQRMS